MTTRPVQTVRMKVVAEFVQTAQGPCDIAMRVSRGSRDGVIRTLGNQATSFPSSSQGGDNNTGWSAQSPRVTVERYKSPAQFTGRAFEVTLRDHTMFYTPVEDPTSGKTVYQQSWAPGSPYTVTTYEKAQFAVTSVNYRNWIYTYSYSQTRREVVNLTLDVPNQPFALGESVLDLGVLQVSDVNSVEGVEPHQEGVAYNSGDRVLMRGKVYQCVGRNVTTFWRPNTVTRNGVATTTWTTPGWSSLGYGTPMGDPRNPSYFSTQRGRKTLEAAFCRMRAAALKRLGAIRVSKVFPWAVARDVTLRDSVRMLIRDGETIVPVKGKVEELKRTIDADGKAFVEVTITVCLGTGLNDEARPAPEAYVRTGYVSGVYAPGPGVAFGPSDTEGYIATGKAANDVEWALSSVRGIPKPIDAFKLADPQYSVLSVTVKNQADEQIGYARQLISAERDPRDVSQKLPDDARRQDEAPPHRGEPDRATARARANDVLAAWNRHDRRRGAMSYAGDGRLGGGPADAWGAIRRATSSPGGEGRPSQGRKESGDPSPITTPDKGNMPRGDLVEFIYAPDLRSSGSSVRRAPSTSITRASSSSSSSTRSNSAGRSRASRTDSRASRPMGSRGRSRRR